MSACVTGDPGAIPELGDPLEGLTELSTWLFSELRFTPVIGHGLLAESQAKIQTGSAGSVFRFPYALSILGSHTAHSSPSHENAATYMLSACLGMPSRHGPIGFPWSLFT
jgi:hypothetical protein